MRDARLMAEVAGICSPVVGGTLALELAAQSMHSVDDRVELHIALAACAHYRRTQPALFPGWARVTEAQVNAMVRVVEQLAVARAA